MNPSRSERLQLIDALRGFALFGILLVNIQSYTWGAGNPLGYFERPPGAAEAALFYALALLVAGKFYAIFALLFGVGFTLQTRRMRVLVGGSQRLATGLYLRRLIFLLGAGLLHGALLYFGDILATYALCALFLVPLAWARTRTLVRGAQVAWALAAALLVFWTALDSVGDAAATTGEIPADIVASHALYVAGSYGEQLRQRLTDALLQTLGGAVLTWPQVIALMLTGAVAGRLGWLRYPERHALLWRRAGTLGLFVGLPLSAIGAALHLQTIETAPDAAFGLDQLFLGASVLLSFGYIAAAVRWHRTAAGRRVAGWLAPAGRMPLTLYLAQSLAMAVLLCGWGVGLGADASRIELTLLAVAIYGVELLVAALLARRFASGPAEWLWRRYTYGRLCDRLRDGSRDGVPDQRPASSTFNQSPR